MIVVGRKGRVCHLFQCKLGYVYISPECDTVASVEMRVSVH